MERTQAMTFSMRSFLGAPPRAGIIAGLPAACPPSLAGFLR
jgi:hypothetical protein